MRAEAAAAATPHVAFAAIDRTLEAPATPPEVRARLGAALAGDDDAVAYAAVERLCRSKGVPTGFSDAVEALLDARRDPGLRRKAASAAGHLPDPSPALLDRLIALARPDEEAELLGAATWSLGQHGATRPAIAAHVLSLFGRVKGSAAMYCESRLQDWLREGLIPTATLVATFDEPEAERRKKLLWLARQRAGAAEDRTLYVAGLRQVLRDPEAGCRDAAIWIMRDAWKQQRGLDDRPLDVALATAAAGDAATFWRQVIALADAGSARDCATGEHLQWIADTAAPDLLAALAAHPGLAADAVRALAALLADTEVRTTPRAACLKLLGRLAAVAPAYVPAVRDVLVPLAAKDVTYDLRYWAERMLKEMDGVAE